MTLPVVPVQVPASIAGLTAAQISKQVHLAPKLFAGVGRSYIHPNAARCWDALNLSCYAATKQWLTAVSTADVFRSYSTQCTAFRMRYTETWTLAQNGLTNLTQNKRSWNGTPANSGAGTMKVYYLRKGQIPCAVPGTGWHPKGLAVDAAIFDPTINDGNSYEGGARNIRSNAVAFAWLKANAVSFGWSWEIAREYVDDPHLHYFAGDNIPKAVLDLEAALAKLGK